MRPTVPMGGQGESNAAAAAASAASAAAQAAAAAVMNQPVASVQASTGTMEQVSQDTPFVMLPRPCRAPKQNASQHMASTYV